MSACPYLIPSHALSLYSGHLSGFLSLVLLQHLACHPPTFLWTSIKSLSIPVTTSHHLQTGNRIFYCHWPDYFAKKSILIKHYHNISSLTERQYMKCGKTTLNNVNDPSVTNDCNVYHKNVICSSPNTPMT